MSNIQPISAVEHSFHSEMLLEMLSSFHQPSRICCLLSSSLAKHVIICLSFALYNICPSLYLLQFGLGGAVKEINEDGYAGYPCLCLFPLHGHIFWITFAHPPGSTMAYLWYLIPIFILPCKSDCQPIFGIVQFLMRFTHV